MRRLGGISLVAVAVAAAAVGLSAHPTAAAGPAAKSTRDLTYSCPVQKAKAVYFYAGTKMDAVYNPYTNDKASPGEIGFATGGAKTTTTGAVSLPKTEVKVIAQKKNPVTIDGKACKKLKPKKKMAFSAKGLPLLVTAEPKNRGYTYQVCDTTVRKVVFRLQIHFSGSTPTSAVFAVQNADKKHKTIALIYWSPKKVTAHFESACNDLRV